MMEAVRNYFLKCPFLKDGALHVNYLGSRPVEYTIDQVPAEPIVKEYVDGSSIRQLVFVFASRESYSADTLDNLAKSSFYDDLLDWIGSNNYNETLPELPQGHAQEVELLSLPYLFQVEEDRARYQIQARVTYYLEEA